MKDYLNARHFPTESAQEHDALARRLAALVRDDMQGDLLAMLGNFQRILADNHRRSHWEEVYHKLDLLFCCGRNAVLDGPMIGVPVAIRDSDYFRATARLVGRDRSTLAALEWMATLWNLTFADSGLWMGKTFEPVSRETVAEKTGNDPDTLAAYDLNTKIGRNFFREPPDPGVIEGLGLPVLTRAWNLMERPTDLAASGYPGTLVIDNLKKEEAIPYTMTGGIFLAQPGSSVVKEMRQKPVYQLNYRWPMLGPVYPMTRLIDELVQIDDGIYLGQLVMATRHYSLGPLPSDLFGTHEAQWNIGPAYRPAGENPDYGYQNNGFFLMIDPRHARRAYADDAFPHLRPRPGESGYRQLGYDRPTATPPARRPPPSAGPVTDWADGWQSDPTLARKFTTFCLEPSPNHDDTDVRELRRPDESILQMLMRIQQEISRQSGLDDHLRHFEKLNRLFRSGVAPRVANGLFQGQGQGFNTRFDAPEKRDWYGRPEPCTGFDYYHGATLNLHLGFGDTFSQAIATSLDMHALSPGALACLLRQEKRGPNVLNSVWAAIGRFIFPWAGKSFERISGRKLSMLLDESDDLRERYPKRVDELRRYPASWPHYDLVKKNSRHHWADPGPWAHHLQSGPWDGSMSAEDREFWEQEAAEHWVFGNNIQDSRILAADQMMRIIDMNYHEPLPSIQQLTDSGPSPFVRQGYIFLGTGDRESILEMNNGAGGRKRVFQFHYRYPLIGGPAPIGTCLDELVEIAEGLFLGQLIYSTVPQVGFHSSVDPADYRYQLFGYFLLMDNTWELHRQAIGFDINRPPGSP